MEQPAQLPLLLLPQELEDMVTTQGLLLQQLPPPPLLPLVLEVTLALQLLLRPLLQLPQALDILVMVGHLLLPLRPLLQLQRLHASTMDTIIELCILLTK